MNWHAILIRTVVLFVSCLGSTHGQAVIGIRPGTTAWGPPTASIAPSGRGQTAPLSSIKSAIVKQGPLAQWGPIAVRPHISYSMLYGDGILRVPGEPENTTIQTLSSGVALEIGAHIQFGYTISRTVYSSRFFEDSTDHNASLSAGGTSGDWRFGISQSYGLNSPTLVETGEQTAERSFSTSGDLGYQISQRSSVDFSLNHKLRRANPVAEATTWTGSDWQQWSSTTWFRYAISPTLRFSAGLGAGYDDIEASADMSYTQPQVQVTWIPTAKISVSGDVGVERRKPRTSNAKIQENTIYSASIGYQLFDTTSLSYSTSQNVSTSYFANQTVKGESWSLGLQQRIMSRVFGTSSYTRGRSHYVPTLDIPFIQRDDRFESFGLSLSTQVLLRGNVSVSYSRSRNLSNNQGFEFTSNQYGLAFAYGF